MLLPACALKRLLVFAISALHAQIIVGLYPDDFIAVGGLDIALGRAWKAPGYNRASLTPVAANDPPHRLYDAAKK